MRLTAAVLVRVVRTVHVVVALLVFADALTVGAGELIRGTADCNAKHDGMIINTHKVCSWLVSVISLKLISKNYRKRLLFPPRIYTEVTLK